ncbi:MAG: transcription antitermination factor NusB, partial [Planctomycetaceae bacterium]|nr:transcription antitermination factor NusB [Planctomycetaceae bacterium]
MNQNQELELVNSLESVNNIDDYSRRKYANRVLARTVAFQVIYQNDMNADSRQDLTDDFLAGELPNHEMLYKFATDLIDGVSKNLELIDSRLSQVSHNWSVERMSPIERSILRLAVYEIFYMDTPNPVVINEAVELAKKFGNKNAPSFVNGVLDRIRKNES